MSACGALALGFDGGFAEGEAEAPGGVFESMGKFVVLEFGDLAAGAADEELRGVVVVLIGDAPDEGGQTFELVDEALFLEEFERAVDGGRGGAVAGAAKLVEQVVGAGRCVAVEDQAENLAAEVGQTDASAIADQAGAGQQCFGSGGKPHQALLGGEPA